MNQKQSTTHKNRTMHCRICAILLAGASFVAAGPSKTDSPLTVGKAAVQAGKAVPYLTEGRGYFVKNTLKEDAGGITCRWLETQDAFDEIFQKTPPLMNAPREKDVDLTGKLAFAVILNCKAMPEFEVSSVTLKDGVLTVAYKKTAPQDGTATFLVPLLVTVEKAALEKAGGAKSVRFVENGKEVGTAKKP